ncbi:uncharacterized protein LOC109855806 isoform X2 [Pseudomyrmex gracilis]|uniref:uncharacterized protein LOC109855806 isoform X2 n=1 Tax=Pseudomyrmex gracilis TaxID=219809 RepID=UPI000994DD68|nr:uncharacterized protein LOC109855806 isoform X2 [Pseudomyrmex gracilis]
MDNDTLNIDFTGITQYAGESGEFSMTSIDFESELHQMESKINYYKSKLQSCRDKYESVQMEIDDAKRMQHKAKFVLNNTQLEEQILHERLKDLHLNYETCVKKSDFKDLDKTIRAKTNELATQRKTLMDEIKQLKKHADENDKKLARVKEKNINLFEELRTKSENLVSCPEDIKQRIDAVLGRRNRDNDI